jgi:ERCC4-type nuclease
MVFGKMPNQIFLDTRERHEGSESACLKSAFDSYGLSYTLQMLPVGDILIQAPSGDTLVCERKTCEDLVLSIMNGRLHSEIEKMNEVYARSILIIEGSWDLYFKKRAKLKRAKYIKNVHFFSSAHKMGMLSSILLRTNTRVVQTSSMDETIQLVNSLSAKFQDGKVFTVPSFKRAKSEEKIFSYVLQSFPGVSEDKAGIIIKSYPTWQLFTKAIEEHTFKLSGFGDKSIKMFEKFLIGV